MKSDWCSWWRLGQVAIPLACTTTTSNQGFKTDLVPLHHGTNVTQTRLIWGRERKKQWLRQHHQLNRVVLQTVLTAFEQIFISWILERPKQSGHHLISVNGGTGRRRRTPASGCCAPGYSQNGPNDSFARFHCTGAELKPFIWRCPDKVSWQMPPPPRCPHQLPRISAFCLRLPLSNLRHLTFMLLVERLWFLVVVGLFCTGGGEDGS